MKNIMSLLVLSTALVFISFNNVGVRDYRVNKIVIDAGHGGRDPGTHGSFSNEKDIALKIALETGRIIKENLPGVEVIYTRDKDSYPSLAQRAELANKNGADLFVSIHCNWLSRPDYHGTETYVMGLKMNEANFEVAKRENSVITLVENAQDEYDGFDPTSPESYILFSLYQSAFRNNSLLMAQNVENQFKTRVGRKSRGVKEAGFWVLYKTAMPSILIETGYLSNAKEERDLNDPLQQTYIASGIYRAFRDYKKDLESLN
ncbi:MAG: N-acetylmuramoyl-L-alanine amidase [Cyclobacteriaceae bacterium]|jgi:N-acetylmuramoyl-L-alanine amidase